METDGQDWSYGWARLSRGTIVSKLDDTKVWDAPLDAPNDVPTAGYTATRSMITIPVQLEKDEDPGDTANPAGK